MTVTARRKRPVPKRLFLTPVAVLVLVLTITVTVAGAASAVWFTSGGGSGTATTAGTPSALTLTPGSAPASALYPGGNANVILTIKNPNSAPVRFAALTLDTGQGAGGYAVDPGHSGCALAAIVYSTQSNGGAGWTVPGKAGATDGTLAVTLVNALSMAPDAVNACQGAGFTAFLKAQP